MMGVAENLLAGLAMRRTAECYALAVDSGDGAAFAAQFTENGILYAPLGRFEGREALSTIPSSVAKLYVKTFHAVFNLVPLINGDKATATTYGIARHFLRDSAGRPIGYEMTLRYQDTFAKSEEGWLLAERRLLMDATHTFPVESQHLGTTKEKD